MFKKLEIIGNGTKPRSFLYFKYFGLQVVILTIYSMGVFTYTSVTDIKYQLIAQVR
jgi:hypothetical protein